jgi:linoleate 10R-lipoxygenase
MQPWLFEANVSFQGESARTPTSGFEDAKQFVPGRADIAVDSFCYGPHECFGQHLALAFITGLVKLVADLKELRPAPGQMGEVKTIQVGFEKVYLNDSWSHLAHNASSKSCRSSHLVSK